MDMAGLEIGVGERERGRAVLELAINQPALDMPERLWKYYIDFEIEGEDGWEDGGEEGREVGREEGRVRALYERLLERTKHVKVWISYATYEGGREGGMEGARAVFERGYAHLKAQELKEERLLLLEAWRALEKEQGDRASLAAVEAKVPQRLKKKRMVVGEDGREEGWEEYYDYAFPDDEVRPSGLAILQKAQAWKDALAKAKAGGPQQEGDAGTKEGGVGKRKREGEEGEEGEEEGEERGS
jgi:crooked neck